MLLSSCFCFIVTNVILFLQRRNGRAVYCGSLENCWTERFRGFESLFLRSIANQTESSERYCPDDRASVQDSRLSVRFIGSIGPKIRVFARILAGITVIDEPLVRTSIMLTFELLIESYSLPIPDHRSFAACSHGAVNLLFCSMCYWGWQLL